MYQLESPPSYEECITNHPEWTKETCKDVSNGTISMGMTKDQVRASWGVPSDINRTVTEYGGSEQWVYGSSRYVYFDGDRLTGWQT